MAAILVSDVSSRTVRCWTCGSLFSTEAPDCEAFNSRDSEQMKTCAEGEACLYYSWKKSATERSVIRECFPTSVLLGNIDNPVEPQSECSPASLESDSISACICTSDLCNGIGDDDINTAVSVITTTRRPREVTTTTTTTTPRPAAPSRAAALQSVSGRVKCHQCGSLFSGSSSNPDCASFEPSDPLQQSYCAAGEVCLWYSWQKSAQSTSFIRQCFSPNILLGSLDRPLVSSSACQPQDISESSLSKITACLCDSDLCNGQRGSEEAASVLPQTEPKPIRQDSKTSRQEAVSRVPKFSPSQQSSNTVEDSVFSPRQTFHPDKLGLQCYSCGSLLNPNKKCDEFSRTDKNQVQTCLKDEACLMYSWKKSPTETATLRECFPTRVLLGSISDPLVALPDCSQKDITDDRSGSIFACLCHSDFCNDGENVLGSETRPSKARQEVPRSSSRKNSRLCPPGFDLVDGECYFVSTERVGWIEARKQCESKGAKLISLDSDKKRKSLEDHITQSSRRRRSEFWTSGNDIDREGDWVWSEARGRSVSPGVWLDSPYNSLSENCLVWSVSRGREGVVSSACCNNIGYICQS